MGNYQSYSCSKLLDFFDNRYKIGAERINYAQYLLTMQNAKTVKKMIGIYDKVLWQFILQYQGLGKEYLVSTIWYNINYVSCDTAEYWWSLNVFLNENIIRLYRELDSPTQEQSLECLLNLRKCDNQIPLQKEVVRTAIMAESDAYKKQDVLAECNEMIHLRDDSYAFRENPFESDGSGKSNNKYKNMMITLISKGYHKSIADKKFEEAGSIHYSMPIKKWNREEWGNRIRDAVILIISLTIVGVIIYFIAEIGLIGIILLIGLPGALIALIKKGGL